MRKQFVCGIVVTLAIAALAAWSGRKNAEAKEEKTAPLAHAVYFTLKDNSAASKQKLVEACKKYLTQHPGEIFFAAGTRVEDLKREVNDQDFDVSLHIGFKDRASHDKYQDAERHKQFIEENKDSWKKVRVFDSLISQ